MDPVNASEYVRNDVGLPKKKSVYNKPFLKLDT